MKSLITSFSTGFSLPSLIKMANYPLFLPFYHTVSNTELPHIQHLYPIKTAKQFEKDLDFLLQYFEPIAMDTLAKQIQQQKPFDRPSFHLTFDDGLSGCYHIIAPILKRKGIPASFFINSDFVDNQGLFYRYQVSLLLHHLKNSVVLDVQKKMIQMRLAQKGLWGNSITTSLRAFNHQQAAEIAFIANIFGIHFQEYLKTHRPYMSRIEIEKLQKDGFHIGAHSKNHPMYHQISLDAQINQTKDSLAFVARHFPSTVRSFAFPFSSDGVSLPFFETMNSHLDISFGTSGLKLDAVSNHLHRVPMEGTMVSAERLIKGEYLYYFLKKQLGKHFYKRILTI